MSRDGRCGCAPCTGARSTAVCPCGVDTGCPWPIRNPAGLGVLSYRLGDFSSFRRAMLRPGTGEQELTAWRPGAANDLALQVVDWWAYVAEVLDFYSELIANGCYLRTAPLPEQVNRLVAVLGYRPRPAIGATGVLAALAGRPAPVALPAGFAVQSKGVPGVEPQTFEIGTPVTFEEPTSVASSGDAVEGGPAAGVPPGTAVPPAEARLLVRGGVLVRGKPSAVAVGDRLMLLPRAWQPGKAPAAAVVKVTALVPERDPHRRVNTRVMLSGTSGVAADAKAADYRLLRHTTAHHPATVPAASTVIAADRIVLDGTARALKTGDPLLLETPGNGPHVVRLDGYEELVWYANANSADPLTPPAANPIPLVVARLSLDTGGKKLDTEFGPYNPALTVRAGWTEAGALLDTPLLRLAALPARVTLAARPAAVAPGLSRLALLEDTRGAGTAVKATARHDSGEVTLDGPADTTLTPPLRLLWDLFPVSRGATVPAELLGLGDATLPGQDFTLAGKPVTYLAGGSRSGEGYSSTVELTVDGIRWQEVPMFHGRGPAERVFVTREDEAGFTHVLTGDGVCGARPHTGAVITATYRVGAGAAVPPAGTLTQILTPVDNLSAVRNPVPPGGGSDADPADRVRTEAPGSVLTFGRAVSGDDYQVVAARAPGVSRATAAWSWDPAQQRAMVRVFVGDDDAAVASARAALRAACDPNLPLTVLPAVRRPVSLRLGLRLDPDRVAEQVVARVRDALLAAPGGLFAPNVLGLGEAVYRSRVEACCLLPGVLAVNGLRLEGHGPSAAIDGGPGGPRFAPGEGAWFDLAPSQLFINGKAGE
ncbi:baseplate J/gp47 family protein [Streptomyces anthocyanicus]|uniref:baseplate J/gp47 family protein n=1 Tax=Streptomyces anthocyanicus TaxID=68174 RepID=UPI00362D4AAD